MKRGVLLFILPVLMSLLLTFLPASAGESPVEERFSYKDYATLLKRFVDTGGSVDYESLKAKRELLDRFLLATARLSPEAYDRFSEKEKIAFWINVYNARTLAVIINNYPTKSIKDIPGAWGGIQFTAAGLKLTLDKVEHEILRKKFSEPRIHMALVCAAHSCPPLRNEPYRGDKLDEQLENQSVRFLSRPENFRLDPKEGVIYISSIFKWYGDDFSGTYGSTKEFASYPEKERAVLAFISKHIGIDHRILLKSRPFRIEYLSYDWILNASDKLKK